MKKLNTLSTKITLALAFLLVFQSCKKNDVQDVAAAENDNISTLQQAVANSVGVSLNSVEYLKDAKQFVVEGDSYVTLEDAKLRFATAGVERSGDANAASQMISYYKIIPAKVNSIKIYADATVPAMWVSALDSAIINWNTSGSRVRMERITTANGANTKVTTTYTASTTIATAAYPDYYGNVGSKVTINTYQNGLSESKKIFALTHEMGHALGFSHTNGTYGTLINGTPSTDPNSVMNSVVLNWKNFTSYDLLAVRSIYPKSMLPGKKRN